MAAPVPENLSDILLCWLLTNKFTIRYDESCKQSRTSLQDILNIKIKNNGEYDHCSQNYCRSSCLFISISGKLFCKLLPGGINKNKGFNPIAAKNMIPAATLLSPVLAPTAIPIPSWMSLDNLQICWYLIQWKKWLLKCRQWLQRKTLMNLLTVHSSSVKSVINIWR